MKQKKVYLKNEKHCNCWCCKRERERELQFSEINGKESKGIKFAFIYNIKKTENKLEVYFRDNVSKNIVLI